MEIEGPFTITIHDNSETSAQELHLHFKAGFQQLPLAKRLETLQQYLAELQQNIARESNEANRQGLLSIAQITEQLYPHLQADEIPLQETTVIGMVPGQVSPLQGLLRSASLK